MFTEYIIQLIYHIYIGVNDDYDDALNDSCGEYVGIQLSPRSVLHNGTGTSLIFLKPKVS